MTSLTSPQDIDDQQPNLLLLLLPRILVTNSLTYLPTMQEILCLEDGRVSERGTYQELMSKEGAFAAFVRSFAEKKSNGEEEEEDEEGGRRRKLSKKEEEKERRDEERGKLIKEEQSKEGNVGFTVYFGYLKSMG